MVGNKTFVAHAAPPFDELPIFYHKKIWLTSEQFFYKIDCTTKKQYKTKYAGVAQLGDEAFRSQCEMKESRRGEASQRIAKRSKQRALSSSREFGLFSLICPNIALKILAIHTGIAAFFALS
ncbi:MAG: hypothetical protein IJI67_00340 [Clostridia bacterium]|nr:hypothetical protein [Clostridia bacterium]